MRIFVAVFAALLTLGLVAFGVVVAQKNTGSAPVTASAAPVSSSQNTVAAAGGEKAPQQLAETTNTPAPFAPAAVVQNNTTAVAPAFPPPTVAPKPVAACNNPDALGLSRLIEIDTTGGPAFGTQHFKQYDFLRDKEVALTFDDGPWPGNTPMVLKALQDNCTKATFFQIGEHATWHKGSSPSPCVTRYGCRSSSRRRRVLWPNRGAKLRVRRSQRMSPWCSCPAAP